MEEIKKILEQLALEEEALNYLYDRVTVKESEIQYLKEALVASVNDSTLRPMTKADVKEGQMYFGKTKEGYYMGEIAEVYHPDDEFKAWMAVDGCRYGLHNKYVIKTA